MSLSRFRFVRLLNSLTMKEKVEKARFVTGFPVSHVLQQILVTFQRFGLVRSSWARHTRDIGGLPGSNKKTPKKLHTGIDAGAPLLAVRRESM